MSIPGFSADRALYTSHRSKGTRCHWDPESENIVPAAVKGSVTIDGKDPDNSCLYRWCIMTWYDRPPYFTTNCYSQWICGHTNPSGGLGSARL